MASSPSIIVARLPILPPEIRLIIYDLMFPSHLHSFIARRNEEHEKTEADICQNLERLQEHTQIYDEAVCVAFKAIYCLAPSVRLRLNFLPPLVVRSVGKLYVEDFYSGPAFYRWLNSFPKLQECVLVSTALEDIVSRDPHTDPESMSDILLEAQDALKAWKPSIGITLCLEASDFTEQEARTSHIPFPIMKTKEASLSSTIKPNLQERAWRK
jgi:hypothetical protein